MRPIKKTAMSKKDQNNNEEVFEQVEQSLNKAEKFIEENSQSLLIGVGVILLLAVGIWGYIKFVSEPAELAASQDSFMAQVYFENDSLNLALKGSPSAMGFLEIADVHSGTEAGNLANYYAGVCYLNLGQYDNAIRSLDQFSSDDPIFGALAKSAIADCFMELNQPSDAYDYYKKALSFEKNELVTPLILKKTAIAAQMNNKFGEAEKYWNQLATEYKTTPEAADAEKFARMAMEAKK